MDDAFAIAEHLTSHGQEHLLVGIDDLTETDRAAFLAALAAVDWAELAHPAEDVPASAISEARVVTSAERAERKDELCAAGEAIYAAGQVAVLMVAGGQGTRLGFSGPKGCYEIGAHSGKSIYQIQAEKVLGLSQRTGKPVPFLVMTSPHTDAETRTFFAAHEFFGLAEDQVRFFSQGTVPSLDQDGKALLKAPGQLLTNPDGHGGCFQALVESGHLQRLVDEDVKQIVYIQVDNILVPVDDPLLVGLATVEAADVVTKVLEKAHPDEKVGHLVRVGERDRIIEYTELTPEETRQTTPNGDLLYRWGSPAMHCWSVAFLYGLGTGFKLPLHRSNKPLKAWRDGAEVEVQGYKSERFIFDLIPEASVSIGLQIDRAREFAPVKNATGNDSAESARALASDCYQTWLEEVGVSVDLEEGALIEISPLYAATGVLFQESWDGRLDRIVGDYYLEGDEGGI